MELTRRINVDQENIHNGKGRAKVGQRQPGQSVRTLGEINTNSQFLRQGIVSKVNVAAAEYEKKATQNRLPLRSNYGHVHSKVDTGLPVKNMQPIARPPLRREESTAGLAAKAVLRTRGGALKENINALRTTKESRNAVKEPVLKKSSQQDKENKFSKVPHETKKILKQPKEKELKSLKPIIKQSTENLEKLKLVEKDQVITEEADKSIELPADIEDIDRDEKNSPLLISIYIKDIYNHLTELEEIYAIEPDHLKNQSVITGKMRATLIDWLVDVQGQFSLVLETLQLTVGILDRYLQAAPNVQRDRLQLVGITAMYIASKYEEIYAPDVSDFVYVTANAYNKQDVFQCERDMLQKLGFCLARPIPLSFLRRFLKAARGTSKHHHLAKYFVDLCLVEYSMAHYRPSELAAAAVCLSLHLLSNNKLEEVWTPTLAYYSKYSLEQIEPIIRKIARVVIDSANSKLKAVTTKYQDVTLAKVACLPQLKGEAIYEIAKVPFPQFDDLSDSSTC